MCSVYLLCHRLFGRKSPEEAGTGTDRQNKQILVFVFLNVEKDVMQSPCFLRIHRNTKYAIFLISIHSRKFYLLLFYMCVLYAPCQLLIAVKWKSRLFTQGMKARLKKKKKKSQKFHGTLEGLSCNVENFFGG